MKSLIATLTLTLAAGSAMAGGGHGPSGVPFSHHGSWVGPAIVGGVIGYVLAQPREVVVQREPVYVQTIPVPQPVQVCETRLVKDMYGIDRMATVCYQR